jgi:hypothetical protein
LPATFRQIRFVTPQEDGADRQRVRKANSLPGASAVWLKTVDTTSLVLPGTFLGGTSFAV